MKVFELGTAGFLGQALIETLLLRLCEVWRLVSQSLWHCIAADNSRSNAVFDSNHFKPL